MNLSNRFACLSAFCEVCDLILCDCSSHFNETASLSPVTFNEDINSISESVNMVAAELQDTQYNYDNLHVSPSMRPKSSNIGNTFLSSDSNLINYVYVSYVSFSGSANNQTHAEQEGSLSSIFLSPGSDHSSFVYLSQGSDNTFSTQHDMTGHTVSNQPNSNH